MPKWSLRSGCQPVRVGGCRPPAGSERIGIGPGVSPRGGEHEPVEVVQPSLADALGSLGKFGLAETQPGSTVGLEEVDLDECAVYER